MRYRPVKKPAPMPENPYHRIFTPMPSFEDLVRKAREEEKKLKNNTGITLIALVVTIIVLLILARH